MRCGVGLCGHCELVLPGRRAARRGEPPASPAWLAGVPGWAGVIHARPGWRVRKRKVKTSKVFKTFEVFKKPLLTAMRPRGFSSTPEVFFSIAFRPQPFPRRPGDCFVAKIAPHNDMPVAGFHQNAGRATSGVFFNPRGLLCGRLSSSHPSPRRSSPDRRCFVAKSAPRNDIKVIGNCICLKAKFFDKL